MVFFLFVCSTLKLFICEKWEPIGLKIYNFTKNHMIKKLAKAYEKNMFTYISIPDWNVSVHRAQHTEVGKLSKGKISKLPTE